VNEGEDEGISLVQAEFLQNLVDFSRIDGAATILVEDLEGTLELLIVLGG
jgi:hypothetical protein